MAHKALLLKGAVSLLIPSCVLIVLNQRLPDTTDSTYKLLNINSFICSPVRNSNSNNFYLLFKV